MRHSFASLSLGLSLSTPSSSATPAPPPAPPSPILLSLSLPPLPPAPAPPLAGATGAGQGRVNGEKQRPRMRRGRVCFQVVAVSLQSEVKEIFFSVCVFFWFSCVHKQYFMGMLGRACGAQGSSAGADAKCTVGMMDGHVKTSAVPRRSVCLRRMVIQRFRPVRV